MKGNLGPGSDTYVREQLEAFDARLASLADSLALLYEIVAKLTQDHEKGETG